jgi:hypothetical protein
MGDEHNSWMVKLGVPQNSFSPAPPSLFLSPADLQKMAEESAARDKKEAEQHLAQVSKAVADCRAYLLAMQQDTLLKMNYEKVIKDARERYPVLADLSEWVQLTGARLPELKSKLPSRRALMETVDAALDSRQIKLLWSISKGKDSFEAIALDHLLAAYMSELPAGVSIAINDGIVQLTRDGAAIAVKAPGAKLDVSNETWKYFDQKLRDDWRGIGAEADALAKLKAAAEKCKAENEAKRKAQEGTKFSSDGDVKLQQMEAEYTLRWTQLQEKVELTGKATTSQISAAVEYLKKDQNNQELLKAGADLEFEFQKMQASLKAYAGNPSVKAALTLSVSGDGLSGKLDVASGVLKASVSASTSGEAKAQIDIALENGLGFLGGGAKISFGGSVTKEKYKFELKFSVGEPVDIGGIQSVFQQADKQIKELYGLVADTEVRSFKDMDPIKSKVESVAKPIKSAVDQLKTLKGKSAIQAAFGFSVEGDWPAGKAAAPPAVTANLIITF